MSSAHGSRFSSPSFLLALLPAYILYKKSRSQVAKALFKIDDPSRKFVSNVFLFGFLLRQTVRVPDLRNPPDTNILENAKLENRPKDEILRLRKSTTGWVGFAQIMTAVFPGVKYGGASLLEFHDERASLPVHNAWLLALGVLHRYSMRKDYGLPLGAAIEASHYGSSDVPLFSGLSGYLSYLDSIRPSWPQSNDDLRGSTRIYLKCRIFTAYRSRCTVTSAWKRL